MTSYVAAIGWAVLYVGLAFSSPQALADASGTSTCPQPTEHVSDALSNLADRLAMMHDRGAEVPMSAVRSIQKGDVRELTSKGDERLCRALYEQGHSERMQKTWNQELSVQGETYPYYDVGYYKVGDYYFALFVKTPTPQSRDLTQTRIVTGYSTALIYNNDLEKVVGYSF